MKSIFIILIATLLGSAAALNVCGICYQTGPKVISDGCLSNGGFVTCTANCDQNQVDKEEYVCCVRVLISKV